MTLGTTAPLAGGARQSSNASVGNGKYHFGESDAHQRKVVSIFVIIRVSVNIMNGLGNY